MQIIVTKLRSLSSVSFSRYNTTPQTESAINLGARGTQVNTFYSTEYYKSYRTKNTREMQECFGRNYIVQSCKKKYV